MANRSQPDHFVQFSPPLIGEEEIAEVVDTLRSGWITAGPKTRQFERDFAEYVGAPSALAFNSCTAALHTVLAASGIGPGDEVITSAMTFAATVNVIEHVGATPVLVDIERHTLNMDPQRVADAVSPRTKAIVPVHFAGHPVDLDTIHDIAERHGLLVLEDAAHAIPASYGGRMIGSGTNPVAFSFYATKNLTTGEGGMLTGDPELIDRARVISLHGLSREAWGRYERGGSWRYDVGMPGFKYNMTDIQASLGLWQLKKLENFHRRRLEIVAAYRQGFGDISAIELPHDSLDIGHAWHLFVIRLDTTQQPIDRDLFIEQLNGRGVGTSVHFIPIHHHSFYRQKYGYLEDSFPIANAEFSRLVSLPLNPSMTERDVAHVIEATRDTVASFTRRRMAA